MKNSLNTICFTLLIILCFISCSKSTEDLIPNYSPDRLPGNSIPAYANYTFISDLYGFKIIPTNSSLGQGVFTLEYNGNTKTAIYTLTYDRINPIQAHIHKGLPTENGPVVYNLGSPISNSYKGSITLTNAQVSDLMGGKLYVDVHSSIFPEGEIRAQVIKE